MFKLSASKITHGTMATTSASHGFTSPNSSNVPAPLADTSPPKQFSTHTTPQDKQIRDTLFHLRRPLIPQDVKLGYIYVTKQADTRFCKVGWASDDPVARIKTIEKKCQVVTEGSWRVGPFFGAFRAERLLHCLLKHVNHLKKNCPCGCVNREWYQEDQEEVIRQAQVVCGWLCRDPCPYNKVALEKKLEPAWDLALKKWESTQDREVPLSWNDFFLFGSSVDIVISSHLPTTPSLPPPLLSVEHMKEVLRSVFKEQKKKTRRAGRRLETRSPDDSENSDTEPDSPTSQPSPLKAKSRETTTRDFETLYDKTKENLSKGARPKRQETWDHWYLALDTNMANDVAPDLIAVDRQAPLSSPVSVSYSHNSPAATHDSQQIATASAIQEHNNHTTNREKDFAGETWYHHRATLDKSERSPKPGEEMHAESTDIGKTSHASGDEDIVDISEKLARMPGAFPTDYTESAAFADMQMCLYKEPGLLYIYQNFMFIKNADGTLCCEKLVDHNWKAIHENRYNIPDLGTFIINENHLVVWVPVRPPIPDELFSRVAFHSRAEVQCSPFGSASTGRGDTQTGSAGPSSSYGDAHNDASRGPASTGSAPTVPASSKTSWSGHSIVLPCAGTAGIPFTPPKHRECVHSKLLSTYQSITAVFWYEKYSFEELRLADYDEGRRFWKQEASDVVEEDSDLETSSSMSDNDRPQAKQRALEEELRDLYRESNCYDDRWQKPKMGHKTPEERLKRQFSRLHTVESLSTEKTPLPTWDDWSEEPSEDDSEDGSWADAHGRETVVEDEENRRERNINTKSAGKYPEAQQELRPLFGPCPNFNSPAKTPLAAYSNPTKQSSVPTFQFSSPTFDITRSSPGFTFTVPPPKSQSPLSNIKIFGSGASKSNYKAPSASSPVAFEGDNNSELGEDMLASSDDDFGRPKVPKGRVKRTKPTEAANTTSTQPLNLARAKQHDDHGRSQMDEDVDVPANKAPEVQLDIHGLEQDKDETIDEAHRAHAACTHARTATPDSAVEPDGTWPSKPRVDDTLARNAAGQIALKVRDTAHVCEDEEDPGYDADVFDYEGIHIPSPAIVWGAHWKLGLGKKRKSVFRERNFLDQQWNFDVK